MKNINIDSYRIDANIFLKDISTREDLTGTNGDLKDALKDVREELGDFQNTLYAHGKYAVLICLQGMDTSGKDSLIREVFKDITWRCRRKENLGYLIGRIMKMCW
jgi:polyphosphate kinase 2 (PPK2 family)